MKTIKAWALVDKKGIIVEQDVFNIFKTKKSAREAIAFTNYPDGPKVVKVKIIL